MTTVPKQYPKHALVQFGGVLGTETAPDEIWSCSIRCLTSTGVAPGGVPVDATVAQQAAYMADIVPLIKAWFANTDTKLTDQAALRFVKVNAISPDGHYFHTTTTTEDHFPSVRGFYSGSNYNKPFDVAMVVSLLTGNRRGQAHRGRIYLPTPALQVGQDGFVNVSEQTIANTTAALISGMDKVYAGSPGIQFLPAVVSGGIKSTPVGAGNPITQVAVGNVFDTQRRRRNALKESYVTANVF